MAGTEQTSAFIYALCEPDTMEVRYIGKANDCRKRLLSHLRDRSRRKTPLYDWINSIVADGKEPVLKILEHSEDWALSEKRLISSYRESGANLLNVAHGGNEPFCSAEQRASNGRNLAKKIHNDPKLKRIWEIKRVLGAALRNGHLSEKTRLSMRDAAKKNPKLFGRWANI